jgi:aminopeptidase N
MAHPVRPDSYIEINNFYTATVYEKGAEVVRMQANLLGPERFRAGTDLYFERHDGQAVTCDDLMLAEKVLLDAIASISAGGEPSLREAFVEAYGRLLRDDDADPSWRALAMQLPSERVLAQRMVPVDPAAVHRAREAARRVLAERFESDLWRLYQTADGADAVASRRLRNAALGALSALGSDAVVERAAAQFDTATNMTDAQAALHVICDHPGSARDGVLERFYATWRHDPLVLDKWFSAQALSRAADTPARVRQLAAHPDFSLQNPNRVRSLLTTFAMGNPPHFHAEDGSGYDWISERVIELDGLNPQVAARLVSSFNAFARYEPTRREHMRTALRRIADAEPSKDVFEIVSRALGSEDPGSC